jgi:DNA-binding SARP family transcriptional activator/predicted ATPase
MPTSLRLFGRPAVTHAGATTELPAERRSQLLVVLALRRSWVSRSELASLLWPDHAVALALTNVRKALHGARAWPWADALEVQGSAVRLGIATDVHTFELALQEGRLADAVRCGGAPLLDGLDDLTSAAWTEWLDGERAHHVRRWHALTRARLRQLQSQPGEANAFARQLLAADPLDEDAVVALLGALADSGRVGEGHEVYHAYAERLTEELGVEPSLRVRQLVRHTARAGAPAAGDGFVGRARELEDLTALLARDECRLLTVTGPGGTGKSRLLKESLRLLTPRFSDGVLWLALDDLETVAQVASRLAAELRIAPGAADDPMPLVCDALRSRAMLLVFDNSEHLDGLPRLIERLLQAAAGLKICATSRIRLHAAGEWLLPLHGLAVDDAAALFAASARAIKPDFDAVAQHAAIVALVQALGGLPLAVLLAANWARLLAVAEIAADLQRSLALLDSDDDGEERPEHRSVRATFEQSWQMLAPRERQVLSGLSTFVGGFSREAAHEVADAAPPLLATLADKSLLQIDGPRCSLHPLLKRFSFDKLDTTARAAAAQRHAAWYHGRLENLAAASDAGDSEAQQAIDADLENHRAAWQWAVAQGAMSLLGASSLALMRFFEVRGRPAEGLALFKLALPLCAAADAPAGPAADVLCAIAYLQFRLYRLDEAAASARRGLKLARDARRRRTLVRCLNVLGLCHWHWGRNREALRILEQSWRHARDLRDLRAETSALGNLATVEKTLGHYERAGELMLQVLDRQRELGDWIGVAVRLNDLAALHQARGQWAPALRYLQEGLSVSEQHGIAFVRPHLMINLAMVSFFDGRLDDAERIGQQVLAEARHAANRQAEATALLHLVRVAARRNDLDAARTLLVNALVVTGAMASVPMQLDGVFCYAEIVAAGGDSRTAAGLMRYYVARPEVEPGDRALAEASLAELPADATAPDLPLDALLGQIERQLRQSTAGTSAAA